MKNTFSLFYGVSGDDRKRLVKTISDFTGSPAKFLGPPTFSYEVGIFNIDRFGCVSFDERADRTMVEKLIGKLQVEGFTTNHDEEPLNNRAPGPDGKRDTSSGTVIQPTVPFVFLRSSQDTVSMRREV